MRRDFRPVIAAIALVVAHGVEIANLQTVKPRTHRLEANPKRPTNIFVGAR